MPLPPGALLGVHLEDQFVGVECAKVHELDEREQVPAMIRDVDDRHVREVLDTGGVDPQWLAGGVRDEQVEAHGYVAEVAEEFGDEFGEVAVHDYRDARVLGQRQLGRYAPRIGEARRASARLLLEPGGEVQRCLATDELRPLLEEGDRTTAGTLRVPRQPALHGSHGDSPSWCVYSHCVNSTPNLLRIACATCSPSGAVAGSATMVRFTNGYPSATSFCHPARVGFC